MTESEALKLERRGRVAILSFNRPTVLNAFDPPLVEATICVTAWREDGEDRWRHAQQFHTDGAGRSAIRSAPPSRLSSNAQPCEFHSA